MLEIIDDPCSYHVCFDNYFASYNLLKSLKEQSYRATGTMRDNLTQKCPVKPSKEIQKCSRGTYDFQFENTDGILIVRQNDNKAVTMETNFDKIEPLASVSQWSKEKKEKYFFRNLFLQQTTANIWVELSIMTGYLRSIALL